MKKILLLIIAIFMITGCKVEYNLEINNDLTISENVSMTGTKEFFDIYYKSSKINVINTMFDNGKKQLLRDNGYKYELVDANIPYIVANRDYNSLNEFVDKTIFLEQYFENININEEKGIITMKTEGFIPISPDSLEHYNIKVTTLKIKSVYEIVSNNAYECNPKDNTCVWYIEDDTEDFSLELSYDTNKIYTPPTNNRLVIVLIIMFIFSIIMIGVYFYRKKER